MGQLRILTYYLTVDYQVGSPSQFRQWAKSNCPVPNKRESDENLLGRSLPLSRIYLTL